MKYKYLIEQNNEYEKNYKEYMDILNKKREALTELNNQTIENVGISNLGYEELKEIIDAVGYNISDELKNKLEHYYMLKKPYEHKVLNDLNFLTKEEKACIDNLLSTRKNSYLLEHTLSTLKEEAKKELIKVLINEDIVEVDYGLLCPSCFSFKKILKKDSIDSVKEYESIKSMINAHERGENLKSEEEIDDLYDKLEKIEDENLLYLYCEDCDCEKEFDNLGELIKYSREMYRVNNPHLRA